jgi:hypothetical protein
VGYYLLAASALTAAALLSSRQSELSS